MNHETDTTGWTHEQWVAEIVADVKAEILATPALNNCQTFASLHEVCDANCLGGLCEDAPRQHPWWKAFGDAPCEDAYATSIIDAAYDEVDRWLGNGRNEYDRYKRICQLEVAQRDLLNLRDRITQEMSMPVAKQIKATLEAVEKELGCRGRGYPGNQPKRCDHSDIHPPVQQRTRNNYCGKCKDWFDPR